MVETAPHIVDQIVIREVAELKANPRNSRTHSADQVLKLAESIRHFGFNVPLLVDDDGMILAGHGRLAAAEHLGLLKVPTVDGSHMTPDQRRAYVIADNQIALLAGWDQDMLSAELLELDEIDFPLDLLGFDTAELDELLKGPPGNDGGGRQPRGSAIVSYNIIFDDADQQRAWFSFLRSLRTRYPAAETVAARLAAFLAEHGNA